jgi:hemin uptake protein HemP
VQSRNLDKFYVRPNADLAGYNKVLIDPVQVEFSKNWWRSVNDPRYVPRIRPEDAQRIADETTANVNGIVADAFKARGYEIATAPGAGVLRVTPRVTELYVNAPDVFPPGVTRSFARQAGEATLVLEARDASSGTLLAVIIDHGAAQDTLRFTQATQVSNTFWFDGLYKRWAANSVAELQAAKSGPRS